MTDFVQLHVITSYPPANLNRDDVGRPKTAVFGGASRLRVSSQSLKRAWRNSSAFTAAVGEHKGTRTREIGERWVFQPMVAQEVSEKVATKAAQDVTAVFGKPDKDGEANGKITKQLVHVSPEEEAAIESLVETLIAEKRVPAKEEVELLRQEIRAADIALFGRMLADAPDHNVEAAAQVAHAITVHEVTVEDDFFTAVDDLNSLQDHQGAGHVGETEYGAGVFYLYLCIDRDRLVANLQSEEALASRTLRGLVEAVCTIAPTGKQNSFASRAYASFVLAERGDQQPRSLSVAFLEALPRGDYVRQAIDALSNQVVSFDRAYGKTARTRYEMDVNSGAGTLEELLDFVAGGAGEPS